MGTDGTDLISRGSGSSIPDAGWINDLAQTATDLGKKDPSAFDLAVDGFTYGLDILSAALDPLGAVFGPAVGLIVDLIPPLKWTVDALTGDPQAISGASETWMNIGTRLIQCGTEYQKSLAKLDSNAWGTDAAEAYRVIAGGYIACLEGVGAYCFVVSVGITAAGLLCAALRGELFKILTDLVIELVIAGATALAAAVPSLGASVEAFVAYAEVRTTMEAASFSTKMGSLLTKLGKAGRIMGEDTREIETLARDMRTLGTELETAAREASAIQGNLRAFMEGVEKVKDIGEKIKKIEDIGKKTVWDPASKYSDAHK